jgi:hypothetical protein
MAATIDKNTNPRFSRSQVFLDTFVCKANDDGIHYFFFEVCSILAFSKPQY